MKTIVKTTFIPFIPNGVPFSSVTLKPNEFVFPLIKLNVVIIPSDKVRGVYRRYEDLSEMIVYAVLYAIAVE